MFLFLYCSNTTEGDAPKQEPNEEITLSTQHINCSEIEEVFSVVLKANFNWVATLQVDWISLNIVEGKNGETALKLVVEANDTDMQREAKITFKGKQATTILTVVQVKGVVNSTVPEGYILVWSDEFDEALLEGGLPALPNDQWWFETGNHGWGNNEDQNYVDRFHKTDTVTKIKNGKLTLSALKINEPLNGSYVISARMNTKEAWQYGYFEMKAQLPGGKGTWAAFWMMPQNSRKWPDDGEIDILEYVGYRPNVVQSTIHTREYNHIVGTEKTGMLSIKKAEDKFHVYGLLWTKDAIIGYCDGIPYFEYQNSKPENYSAWPFDQPFYLKLNLAIGGNWGGLKGVDQNIFPAEYIIDYVRVYQK